MGGAAGHLKNAWEATDFTFAEVKNLVHEVLTNKLELFEKLDGQNLMLTWRDDNIYIARTGKHLRDFGDYAIPLEDIWRFFGENTPDTVRSAYKKAGQDFYDIFSLIDDNITYAIFEGGRYWLNAEILYEDTENVIHYGVNEIRMHNFFEVSDSGKKVGTKELRFANDAFQLIEDYIGELNYTIRRTNKVQVKRFDKIKAVEAQLFKNLSNLQFSRGLNDDDTLEYFLILTAEQYIMDNAPKGRETEKLIDPFTRRWILGKKPVNINILLKEAPIEVADWYRYEDKNLAVKKFAFFPLVIFFLKLSVVVLKNLEGLTAKNPVNSRAVIIKKTEDAINFIRTNAPVNDIDTLMYHMKVLEEIGNLNSITPIEGVVFTYKDHILKLTGAFSPLIQLIGYSKYTK